MALLAGLLRLVFLNAADLGADANRCATAERPNDFPNLGCKASFKVVLSTPLIPLDCASPFRFSASRAA